MEDQHHLSCSVKCLVPNMGQLEEEVGFEPTDGFPSAIFKIAPISHSGTLPKSDSVLFSVYWIESRNC